MESLFLLVFSTQIGNRCERLEWTSWSWGGSGGEFERLLPLLLELVYACWGGSVNEGFFTSWDGLAPTASVGAGSLSLSNLAQSPQLTDSKEVGGLQMYP